MNTKVDNHKEIALLSKSQISVTIFALACYIIYPISRWLNNHSLMTIALIMAIILVPVTIFYSYKTIKLIRKKKIKMSSLSLWLANFILSVLIIEGYIAYNHISLGY